jgi:hypothetical protein
MRYAGLCAHMAPGSAYGSPCLTYPRYPVRLGVRGLAGGLGTFGPVGLSGCACARSSMSAVCCRIPIRLASRFSFNAAVAMPAESARAFCSAVTSPRSCSPILPW